MATEETVGYRLSPQQRHAWKLKALNTPTPSLLQCEINISGALDAERLKASVRAVVEQCEILRTGFVQPGGLHWPLQVISPEPLFRWYEHGVEPAVAISQRKKSYGQEKVEIWSREAPVDYEHGPMLTAWLLHEAENEHKLVISVPCICADRTSLHQIAQLISTAYANCNLEAKDAAAPQYADLSSWLNDLLEEKNAAASGRDFWRTMAATNDDVQLPQEQCGSLQPSVGKVSQALPLRHAKGLRKQSESDPKNEEAFLLAAWYATLFRLSEAITIKVAVNLSGRCYEDMQSAIGPLERQVPIALEVTREKSFSALTHDVQQLQERAREIQEYYDPETERTTIAPTGYGFGYEAYDPSWKSGGLEWEITGKTAWASSKKAVLWCSRRGNAMDLELYHDRSVLNEPAARRILRQYSSLLKCAIEAGEERAIGELSLADADEERQILKVFNRTAVNHDLTGTVLALFRKQVKHRGDEVALIGSSEQLTYAELDKYSNGLAANLRVEGVRREEVVGLCVDRGAALIVAMLGVWKAGAAFVPLDSDYPAARLAGMLDKSGVKVILAGSRHLDKIKMHGRQVLVLHDCSKLTQSEAKDLSTNPESDNLAYVIYTSGSTGEPKGVMIEHRSLLNHMLWVIGEYGLGSGERMLMKTNISFDAFMWEWLFPLLQGGVLVLGEPGSEKDVRQLIQTMREKEVTTLQVVPTLLRLLLEDDEVSQCRSLRRVFAGGENLDEELTERYRKRVGKDLINLYGPTEATIDVTSITMTGERGAVIGRPISNVSIYVLQELGLAAIGEPGELCISGTALARGYEGLPMETAIRYVPDPYCSIPGSRMYKTGDRARWREDGVLEFLGRRDEQVKIRGYRIELGEIERVLKSQPSVVHAVVVVKERSGGDRRLVAYLQLQDTAGGESITRIRTAVQEQLPEYMCPSLFIQIAKMPQTASGKVDRRALPEPESAEAERSGTYVSPRNEMETALVRIWSAVLGQANFGVTDNFFQLGGDSIIGIQIVARARREGIELTPKQLFQHQTIAELAVVAGKNSVAEAEQGEILGEARLTPIQEEFFARVTDNRNHFNQAFLYELSDGVREDWLERSLAKLVEHHDVLRSRFVNTGGRWKQSYASIKDNRLQLIPVDLSQLDPGEQLDALRSSIDQEQRSLDIENGPLIRATLFRLGEKRGRRLLIAVHHLAIDGVSWRILMEDVARGYEQLSRGEEIRLPAKTTSFKKWAEKLAAYASGPELAAETPYWEQQAERHTECLPYDFPDGRNEMRDEARIVCALNESDTRKFLTDTHKAYQTQVMDLLLASLMGALKRWRGMNSVRVHLEGHGREEVIKGVDLTRTVGWFTDIYPIALSCHDSETSGGRLTRIRDQLKSVPQKGIGYGVLRFLRENNQDRSAEKRELLINYSGKFDEVLSGGGLLQAATEGTGALASRGTERSSSVELNAAVFGGRLQIVWGYSKEQFLRETIEALAKAFQSELVELISHCVSKSVSDSPGDDSNGFHWDDSQLAEISAAIQKAK
jgi:amino acid adenylation domain-containing protein/non-ribosomal peptide synthase protein (TIGR01720 family)